MYYLKNVVEKSTKYNLVINIPEQIKISEEIITQELLEKIVQDILKYFAIVVGKQVIYFDVNRHNDFFIFKWTSDSYKKRRVYCILWGVTKYINYVLKKNSVEGYCAKIQNGICIYLC